MEIPLKLLPGTPSESFRLSFFMYKLLNESPQGSLLTKTEKRILCIQIVAVNAGEYDENIQ